MSDQRVTGWGRAISSTSRVVEIDSVHGARRAVDGFGPRGGIGRGAGRSYGDPAQCAGGIVVGTTGLRAIGEVDRRGHVVCASGVTVHDLLGRVVPEGWFVPVTPGTRFVTIGGAIAADIHGKNHHRDGSFGAHVDWIDLIIGDGTTIRCSPEHHQDLFYATLGGMGLTGLIVAASIALTPIETSKLLVDTLRFDRIDELADAMIVADQQAPYSVAWVDCLGSRRGRSVLTTGRFARIDEIAHTSLQAPGGRTLTVPPVPGRGIIGPATVTAFNTAWFHAAPRERIGETQSIGRFFHPLDALREWPRLYGPRGFLQWQFVVPDDATSLVTSSIDALHEGRIPCFLAVLKRFGPGNIAPLSFPIPGWTLAVDIPAAAPGLAEVLDRLDAEIAASGGRIYLAKDSRLHPRHVPMMYPRLDEWREARAIDGIRTEGS